MQIVMAERNPDMGGTLNTTNKINSKVAKWFYVSRWLADEPVVASSNSNFTSFAIAFVFKEMFVVFVCTTVSGTVEASKRLQTNKQTNL